MNELTLFAGVVIFMMISIFLSVGMWALCMGCIHQGIDPLKPAKEYLREFRRTRRVDAPDELYAIRNKKGLYLNRKGDKFEWSKRIAGNGFTLEGARIVLSRYFASVVPGRSDKVRIVEMGYKQLRKV